MPNPFDQGGSQQPQQFEDKSGEEFLADFVGDDKKYKTVEEMARALAHANHHIGTLEGETSTLREQVSQSKTIDDVMARLAEAKNPEGTDTGGDDPSQQPKQDGEDVEATVKRLLEQQMSTQSANSNKQSVIDAMTKQFGTKAGDIWDSVEKELGVDLEQMSANSPSAVLKLLGVTGEQAPSQSGSSFNGDAQKPRDTEERPPEGSKRLVDYMLAKGEITREQAYKEKLRLVMEDPDKFKA